MQIVKHSQWSKVSPTAGTTIWEYPTKEKNVNDNEPPPGPAD